MQEVVFPNMLATITGLLSTAGACISTIPQIAPAAWVRISPEIRLMPARSTILGNMTMSLTSTYGAVLPLASGHTAPYVEVKDIVMFPSIVDLAGINRISGEILTHAAGAICGMVEMQAPAVESKPVIVAS